LVTGFGGFVYQHHVVTTANRNGRVKGLLEDEGKGVALYLVNWLPTTELSSTFKPRSAISWLDFMWYNLVKDSDELNPTIE
jgi:hypothetical protein